MQGEKESSRQGLTRVYAVRKPNVRGSDYRVEDGIIAELRVTVLAGNDHGGVLRLRFGENVATVDPNGTASFPVHRNKMIEDIPAAADPRVVDDRPSLDVAEEGKDRSSSSDVR